MILHTNLDSITRAINASIEGALTDRIKKALHEITDPIVEQAARELAASVKATMHSMDDMYADRINMALVLRNVNGEEVKREEIK